MTVYLAARMLHIFGALGMFVALGIDLAGVAALGRARTAGQARRALEGYRLNGFVGPISLLSLLVPGIYMAIQWGWPGWLRVSMFALLLILVLGGAVARRRLAVIAKALPAEEEALSAELQTRA